MPSAKQIILGVKQLPNHSESFLAAASYQRTADALVSSAIMRKVDHLDGIKENIIVGNRMPAGTGMEVPSGKYDIDYGVSSIEEMAEHQGGLEVDVNFEEEAANYQNDLIE